MQRRRRRRRRHLPCPLRFREYLRQLAAFLFSNVGVIGLVVAYMIAGAFIFQAIEGSSELERVQSMAKRRRLTAERLWHNATLPLNIFDENLWKRNVSLELREYQRVVVRAVRRGWAGSDDLHFYRQWSFPASFLYSLTIITTIGYGNIAPRTDWGKVTSICYAMIGMPLFLLYLTNLGDVLARSFKWFYVNLCLCRGCPGIAKRRAMRLRMQIQAQLGEPLEVLSSPRPESPRRRQSAPEPRARLHFYHQYHHPRPQTSGYSCDRVYNSTRRGASVPNYYKNYDDIYIDNIHDDVYNKQSRNMYDYSDYRPRDHRNNREFNYQKQDLKLYGDPYTLEDLNRNTNRCYERYNHLEYQNDKYSNNNDSLKRKRQHYNRENNMNTEEPKQKNEKEFNHNRLRAGHRNYKKQDDFWDRSKIISGQNDIVANEHTDNDEVYDPIDDYGKIEDILDDYGDSDQFTYITIDSQNVTVPITICVIIMAGYIFFGTMLFSMWEDWNNLDGSYFCFISLTSIGFGDIVPGERIYSRVSSSDSSKRIDTSFILCSMYLLFGMALVAMCFNLMQEQVVQYIAATKRVLRNCIRCNVR